MRYINLVPTLRREWPIVVLAARGTLAALAALAVAILLRLECPYWAAMTALIVIQPTRGLLLEKSYFRLVGTAIGSVSGMIMLLSSGSPAILTLMLSFWLAACVGLGNLLYGLRSYSAMVTGLTGVVIAMAGYNNPPHLHNLVFDRIACITIGIIVSTTLTLFFTQRQSKRKLLNRLHRVTKANIEWVALLVRGNDKERLLALRQDILVEIADIENSMDSVWAGSLDLKRRKRHVRNLIVSQLSLLEAGKLAGDLLARHDYGQDIWRETLARQLEQGILTRVEAGSARTGAAGLAALPDVAAAQLPLLGETLSELFNALQLVADEWDTTASHTERPACNTFIRHRDWHESGRAALRAASAIVAVGAAWYLTGWKEGPLMIMATSIMVSIFSTHDRPAVMLSHILRGALFGVAAAFLCRLVLLPGASSPLQQVLVTAPVLMAGIVALFHRRTALGAMDFMLFFLFVMQPGLPAVAAPAAFAAGGLACLGGIAVAMLAFRILLPIDPARRLRSILLSIVHDLNSMTETDSLPMVEKYRARTNHRVLRMLTYAGKLNSDLSAFVEGGLAALAIGRYMQRAREEAMNGEISPIISEAIADITFKLSLASRKPERILSVLTDGSIKLSEAAEACPAGCNASARHALSTENNDQDLSPRMFFAGGQTIQCHI